MQKQSWTFYLLFVVFSITLGAFQYGYHTGELNTPQQMISKCKVSKDLTLTIGDDLLPPCLPMSDARYSLVVAMLLAGGLIGALSASYISDKHGRRKALVYTNLMLGSGSFLMTISPNIPILMLGRFIAGIGGGIITVVVPAYISECVPKSTRGFFGTLNQLAIVVGIMVSQIIGMMIKTGWRWILFFGVVAAIVQLSFLPFCVDSPRYLASKLGGTHKAKQSLLRLRGPPIEDVEEEIEEWRREALNNNNNSNSPNSLNHESSSSSALLSSVSNDSTHHDNSIVTIKSFIFDKQHRHPLFLILLLQLSQQFSGINAVIFYSTSIMSTVFPEYSDRITVFISVVNLIMTLISAYLMDKSGRRTLFLWSTSMMACSSLLLGWSIKTQHDKTSAIAIVAFVAAFAIGLGPIPFLMIPELVETPAAASAGSIGLASNMISNFTVSAGFMALRDIIGQGQVFYVFAVILLIATILGIKYLPETKNRSTYDIVKSKWAVPNSQYHIIPHNVSPTE
ncbi:general substrate transporter [Cunninghamella echinulata]|nr:general substrate transporter [Cunninghamella echinulata]